MILFLNALLLVGCGEEEPPTPEEEAAFVPTEGTWTLDVYEVADDPCGLHNEDLDFQGNQWELFDADETGLMMRFDVDLVADCTLDDQSFDCASFSFEEDLNPDVDARLQFELTPSGTFVDETHYTGSLTNIVTCEGPGCPDVETFFDVTFPCPITYDTESSLTGG